VTLPSTATLRAATDVVRDRGLERDGETAATPSRAGSVVERLLPVHPVTQVIMLQSCARIGTRSKGFSNFSQPARNLAEALIDHRFSLLLPPEFTRDLRVLDLSQSAASPGAVGRVLALGDAFEPELL
jgi:hypothetical protein